MRKSNKPKLKQTKPKSPDAPKKLGRPEGTHTEMTPEQWEIFERVCGLPVSLEKVCAYVGISYDWLMRRMKDDPLISATLEKRKARFEIELMESAYHKAIERQDSLMIIWLTKTQLRWCEPKDDAAGVTKPTIPVLQWNVGKTKHITDQEAAELMEKYIDKPASKAV